MTPTEMDELAAQVRELMEERDRLRIALVEAIWAMVGLPRFLKTIDYPTMADVMERNIANARAALAGKEPDKK